MGLGLIGHFSWFFLHMCILDGVVQAAGTCTLISSSLPHLSSLLSFSSSLPPERPQTWSQNIWKFLHVWPASFPDFSGRAWGRGPNITCYAHTVMQVRVKCALASTLNHFCLCGLTTLMLLPPILGHSIHMASLWVQSCCANLDGIYSLCMHLLITPVQLMRPGLGQNPSCAVGDFT